MKWVVLLILRSLDTDEIANKLMTWFKKKYNTEQELSLYKLAAALMTLEWIK
jgi:hypothetical protein